MLEQRHDEREAGTVTASGAALPASAADTRPPIPARDYAYYRAIFSGRRMPFAFVDLDLLDANVRAVRSRAGGKRIRVASKSVRCVAILRRLLAADESIQGLMAFTAREAVWLAAQGFDDLLIGYPCVQPDDLAAVARATAEGAHITLMVDSIAQVERIEAAARAAGIRLPLCLDIDMALPAPGLHFGTWRSPLRTPADVRPVVARITGSAHVSLDGIMGYEAQIAGVGDSYPGKVLKNALVRRLKARSVREVARRRAAIVQLAEEMGARLRFVNGGGTGSIATTQREPAVTEITVGSAFYAPALFDNYREFRYLPAAGYAVEIVRRPAPGIYTCLGGGYTASGAAGADKAPQPFLPVGARLDTLEGAGEVQTPIHYAGPERLDIADPIFLRHSKAGELCERFTSLLLVQNGMVVGETPTYRGEGQCFL
jgi:D-serine deaminase-like pyridoxal phosphate-dependent protein